MLYSAVKACQGAAPEEMAHSNVPLLLPEWGLDQGLQNTPLLLHTLQIKIKLTCPLQQELLKGGWL